MIISEELKKVREQKISKDLETSENLVRHAFNQGYELGYQQGIEDGRKQGNAAEKDRIYWDGYHAAQEDGKKIYQKGLDDAWTIIRKMYHDFAGNFGEKLKDAFGYRDCIDVVNHFSVSEAIEKIQEYEKKQKEARSGYVVCDEPIKPEKTVFPQSPCDLCRFNSPRPADGKPCTMYWLCPAEGKVEE